MRNTSEILYTHIIYVINVKYLYMFYIYFKYIYIHLKLCNIVNHSLTIYVLSSAYKYTVVCCKHVY